MISSLRGTVKAVRGNQLILDVCGVGYSVNVTADHAATFRIGTDAFVHTTLIVREDAWTLFGFSDLEQLDVFSLLIGVTGVGPKSAMGVLSVLSPTELAVAIQSENDAAFKRVSGIGPKTAKLIILALTGKVFASNTSAPALTSGQIPVRNDVVEALMGLGWSERSAHDVVAAVTSEDHAAEPHDTATVLRNALALLGSQSQAGRQR